MRKTRPALAAAAACLFAVSACSTTEPEAAGGGGSGDVETGNGVTDDTIGIGVLTDLSGPFAAGAAVQVTEFQAYWDQVNADGGICDRDVEMQVQDHAYDPQKAVSLFRSISSDVVALQQVLGGPTSAAVLPAGRPGEPLRRRRGLGEHGAGVTRPTSCPGASYSIQGANAIDYLVDELGIAEGDSVGVVYFVGDYGNDALAGAEYAAEERGLTVIPQEITPATTDLSAQASSLVQDGASAVILAAAPGQLASLAGVLASQGADIPIVGMNPTFNPALLKTPAADVAPGQRVQRHQRRALRLGCPGRPGGERAVRRSRPRRRHRLGGAAGLRRRPSCCAPRSRGPARRAT